MSAVAGLPGRLVPAGLPGGRWPVRLSFAARRNLIDVQDDPGPVLPFQGVEAAVVLGKRVGLAELRTEGGQHLAVDGIMTNHHHCGAAVAASDVGQARDRNSVNLSLLTEEDKTKIRIEQR